MLTSWETTWSGDSAVYKLRRKLLSQNFLYSRTLVNFLVRNSSIGQNDTVLEIGPGKGSITSELLQISGRVIAIEIDHELVIHLRKTLGRSHNLELMHANFLHYRLPVGPYKVFSNIPFSIEGQVIRKLLDCPNPPDDCYLVIRNLLALRLSGIPHENQFSLKHKPWFDFSIYHHFKKSDFTPPTKVESVMWKISRRENPMLPWNERQKWERFIETGFGNGTQVKQNLRKILTQEQINQLSGKLNFSLKIRPGYLSLNQWLQIYSQIKTLTLTSP